MPGHFLAWARFTDDSAWNTTSKARASVIRVLESTSRPSTGLLPDFIVGVEAGDLPAPAKFLEDDLDGDRNCNARRVRWLLTVDAMHNGDATSAAQARKMSESALKTSYGAPPNVHAGHHLGGSPLSDSDHFSTIFGAPLVVDAMLDASKPLWLNVVDKKIRMAHQDYFEERVQWGSNFSGNCAIFNRVCLRGGSRGFSPCGNVFQPVIHVRISSDYPELLAMPECPRSEGPSLASKF